MDFSDTEIRILLVEDDRRLAEARLPFLAELGQVTWAPDAECALRWLVSGDWNVVIVALDLPRMDGVGILQAIRSIDPSPVALVIGDGHRFEHALAAIRGGASDYVAKAAAPEELLRRVTEAVELDRSNRIRRVPTERVLAIGAHPDDVEFGCGGILLRHHDAGHSLTILTLTCGEAGGEPAVRRTESERAAALLSSRLLLLGLNDTEVSEAGATISAISNVIEEVRPTTIYTHAACDLHQDHRCAHHATMVAARSVPLVYAYQSPSATVEFRPSRFVSIDDVLDRKLELIEPYVSQTGIRRYLARDLLRATARYWGRFATSDYAEPLEVLRQDDIVSTLSTPAGAARRRRVGARAHATV